MQAKASKHQEVQPAMLSAAISSVSSDLSGAAGSDLADHFLPSHLARAQEAYNRVSEHLSNIKSSRAKAAKALTSPAPEKVPENLGVPQLEAAMEELLAGRRSMQESREKHLALRSQITAELQSSKLALWEPQVPSILAASGIATNGEETREHAPAEEPPLHSAQAVYVQRACLFVLFYFYCFVCRSVSWGTLANRRV